MPCNDVSQIVLQMVQVAKEAQSPTLSLNVAKVVASLINKLTNGKSNHAYYSFDNFLNR